jgi:hypothetical protein
MAEYLRVMEARFKDPKHTPWADDSVTRAIPVMIALGDWEGPERVWEYVSTAQVEDLCEAMARSGKAEAALKRAVKEAGPVSRAVALLGVARGEVARSSRGRVPRYEGQFAVRVPDPPKR